MADIDLKIITLNCRGLRDRNKKLAVFEYLKGENPDVTLLQETFITGDIVNDFNRDWDGDIFHGCTDSSHSRGVAVMFKPGLNPKVLNCHKTDDGRKIMLNIDIHGNEYSFVSVYAPEKNRTEFLKKLHSWVTKHTCDINSTIIGADLNTIDNPIDRSSGNLDHSSSYFSKLKDSLSLTDTWRNLNPSKIEYTYMHPSGNSNSRIDYILCSKRMAPYLQSSKINVAPVPDHKAVVSHIFRQSKKRGRGYWKLNNSFLNEKTYCNEISNIISKTLNEYDSIINKRDLWDLCKIRIKEYSIKFGINKRREYNNNVSELQDKINKIDRNMVQNMGNKDYIAQRNELKRQLDSLLLLKAKGAQIRSRAEWVEKGERSAAYFTRLEKERQTFNRIDAVRTENGDILVKDSDILTETTRFYSQLYSSGNPDPDDIDKYLHDTRLHNILNENDQSRCDGILSKDECEVAIKGLKKNKSPGLDGITAEFYQKFGGLIIDILINSFNESYTNIELSGSQRQSILSLIYKKNEKERLSNYRPITIANTDYKILAFILSNRVHKILDKIISTDQSGFMKKRFIGHNIRLIQDVIDYAQRHKTKGLLLFLDFEKAFDSVEWPTMLKILRKFNFGDSFITWVKTLYKNPILRVKNNGHISDTFSISRGIKQGCPLSALLFILVVEILSLRIKENPNIQGFKVQVGAIEKEFKISQYADDGTLLLHDINQIDEAIRQINALVKLLNQNLIQIKQ